MALPRNHYRALVLLADAHNGTSESIVRKHGVTAFQIAELIIAGLAQADDDGGIEVRLRITEAGRRALAGS
jgi:hypothetical protein